jgi:hypothetical protein
LLWWLWCCLIGHVLSSNIPLYPGSRTTGVCSTCKCLCLSFYNIYYIVVTRYCNFILGSGVYRKRCWSQQSYLLWSC